LEIIDNTEHWISLTTFWLINNVVDGTRILQSIFNHLMNVQN